MVTWAQYDILEALRLHGDLTPSALSQKLGISRQNLSKSLKVLKQHKLITQSPLEKDKRTVNTRLSTLGCNFLARAAQGRTENAIKVQTTLTTGEQAIFIELCNKVSQALETK